MGTYSINVAMPKHLKVDRPGVLEQIEGKLLLSDMKAELHLRCGHDG